MEQKSCQCTICTENIETNKRLFNYDVYIDVPGMKPWPKCFCGLPEFSDGKCISHIPICICKKGREYCTQSYYSGKCIHCKPKCVLLAGWTLVSNKRLK